MTSPRRRLSRRTSRLLLWCAATDSTFERAVAADGTPVLLGKCIHCNARHTITEAGAARTSATVEHIIPRTHGGTDALDNLAIACARCNIGKGHRLDDRPWQDPTLQRVIATLKARRAARTRPPPPWLDLPPLAPGPDDDA